MRQLTIKRKKTFTACMGTVKIYLEDPTSSELTINGVACRKLGELRNGEERTFVISEEETRVFAISDRRFRNFQNDFIRIPAGEEDIYRSGRFIYNRFTMNPFFFDNPVSWETLQNRRRQHRRLAIPHLVLILLMVGICLLWCSHRAAVRFFENGIEITLIKGFQCIQTEEFDACFKSNDDIYVLAQKETFDQAEGLSDLTLEAYGERFIQSNDLEDYVTVQNDVGFPYFEYI